MRLLALAILLAASTCSAQQAETIPSQSPAASPTQAASQVNPEAITISAGTRIPLTLASPITSKTRPGDAVRAVVAFPVTVGTLVAIPAGTYVQGTVAKISKRGRPSVQMRFTDIVYANGYTVPVNGANIQARLAGPPANAAEGSAFASGATPNYALAAQSTGPMPPPLPPMPSHVGAIVGIAVASVATVVVTILIAHHHGGGNGVLFDTGWQFDMVLQSSLTVDGAKAAVPNAQ